VDIMTGKERWLAAMKCEPVDRLNFWAKLDGSYPKAQAEPFRDMELGEIFDLVGCERPVGIGSCVRELRTDTAVDVREENGERRTRFVSPVGTLTRLERFDDASDSWHPIDFPVKTVEDIKVMTRWYEDSRWELDAEALERARADYKALGEDAFVGAGLGESPLMHWVEWVAGIENAHFLLCDYPRETMDLFEAMHRSLVQKIEILAEHQIADYLVLGENTSTTLISVAQYRDYCFDHVREYCRIVADRGGNMMIHMCGHLKDLLGDLARLGARCFEAFTAPPVGNTTLLDGRTACPDVCLIGGTSAVTWLKSAEEIIGEIESALDALPHTRGIVVSSAGVMPPLCKPRTIKKVTEWVHAFPVRN